MSRWSVVIGGLVGIGIASAIAYKWCKETAEKEEEILDEVNRICRESLENTKMAVKASEESREELLASVREWNDAIESAFKKIEQEDGTECQVINW